MKPRCVIVCVLMCVDAGMCVGMGCEGERALLCVVCAKCVKYTDVTSTCITMHSNSP